MLHACSVAVNTNLSPSPGSSTEVAVGGAVGGVILALFVVVTIVTCIMLVIGRHFRAKQKNDAIIIDNAGYRAGEK